MKRLATLTTMILMIALLAVSVYAQNGEQNNDNAAQEPQGVHLLGPAPNAGDGVPDGSGWDHEATGAPNSGDGIPDGSGWDKVFVDEDGDGFADNRFSGTPQAFIYGLNGTPVFAGALNRSDFGPGEAQPAEGPGPLDGAASFGVGAGVGVGVGQGEPADTSEPNANQSGSRGKR